MSDRPLLSVEGLCVEFATDSGTMSAVDGIDLAIERGGTLALVGESGCGKSMTALAIMGLVPEPPGRVAGGHIRFDGTELTALSPAERRGYRGNKIAMIFQEPMTSLNPAFTIGDQIGEGLIRHRGLSPARRPAPRRSRCCAGCICHSRNGAPLTTRTASRAGCVSAR